MILNNFKKTLIGSILSVTSTAMGSGSNPTDTVFVDGTVDNITQSNYWSNYQLGFNKISTTPESMYSHIGVGSGNTAPTADDYNLENELTSLTCTSASMSNTSEMSKQFTATFSNQTGEDVTVKEVGWFVSSYYSTTKTKLFERTVLDTPVTIPNGESRAFTVEISM